MANDAGQIARAKALEEKRKWIVTPAIVQPEVITPTQPVNQMEAIKKLPQYQELLGKWYTEEQIATAVGQYKPKTVEKTTTTAVVPTAEVKPVTPAVATEQVQAPTAKVEPQTPKKDEQTSLAPLELSEYQDDSTDRQNQIVSNLNQYRQSNPIYMKDLDTFKKTFSYGLRSQTQKDLLNNRYLWYQKWLDLDSKGSNELLNQYNAWSITESDLEQLKLQNPSKYSEIRWLIDKKSTLNTFKDELYWTETDITSKIDTNINVADDNLFEIYKKLSIVMRLNDYRQKSLIKKQKERDWIQNLTT